MGIIRTWLNDHEFIDRPDRNEVLEEVAKEFDKMKSLRWLDRRKCHFIGVQVKSHTWTNL